LTTRGLTIFYSKLASYTIKKVKRIVKEEVFFASSYKGKVIQFWKSYDYSTTNL